MSLKNYTPYGADPALDALYEELMVIENREIDAISYGRLDLLPEIRLEQLPLKARINRMEGCSVYEEAEILHGFYEHGGITLVFRSGHKFHEATPETITAREHMLRYHE